MIPDLCRITWAVFLSRLCSVIQNNVLFAGAKKHSPLHLSGIQGVQRCSCPQQPLTWHLDFTCWCTTVKKTHISQNQTAQLFFQARACCLLFLGSVVSCGRPVPTTEDVEIQNDTCISQHFPHPNLGGSRRSTLSFSKHVLSLHIWSAKSWHLKKIWNLVQFNFWRKILAWYHLSHCHFIFAVMLDTRAHGGFCSM